MGSVGHATSDRVSAEFKLWARAVVFTLLVPSAVAVLIPFLAALRYTDQIELGKFNIIGAPFLLAGMLLYLASVALFVMKGGGTPAVWFARFLAPLIGKEPEKLVAVGCYKWTRNPMYLGVVLVVFGQGLLRDLLVYHFYACFLWLVFHGVVTALEEPHLKKKFGKPYEEYLKKTPRWIGFSPDPPVDNSSP